jgi:hypothetical protein
MTQHIRNAGIKLEESAGSDVRQVQTSIEGSTTLAETGTDRYTPSVLLPNSTVVAGSILMGTALVSIPGHPFADDRPPTAVEVSDTFADAHRDYEFRNRIEQLSEMIAELEANNESEMDRDGGFYVLESIAARARSFLNQLSPDLRIPSVAPDGDGGIVFRWEKDGSRCLLVLDEESIHIVVNAGSQHAVYLDDLAYRGGPLPQIVRCWMFVAT